LLSATDQARNSIRETGTADLSLAVNAVVHCEGLLRADRAGQMLTLSSHLVSAFDEALRALGTLALRRRSSEAVALWAARTDESCLENVDQQACEGQSQNNIAEVFLSLGDLAAAMSACERGLAIRERLLEANPSRSELEFDVAASVLRIADIL